jgi:hypothetical protein
MFPGAMAAEVRRHAQNTINATGWRATLPRGRVVYSIKTKRPDERKLVPPNGTTKRQNF